MNVKWLLVGLGIILSSDFVKSINLAPFLLFLEAPWAENTQSIIHLVGELSRELGFAIIVAVFVGYLIEAGHRKILNERIDLFMAAIKGENVSARDDIKLDAFSAVFKKTLPSEYVDEVLKTSLDIKIIRTDFDLSYSFEELPERVQSENVEDYMLVKCRLKCVSKNISNDIADVPFNLRLPNPRNESLQELVRVNSMKSGPNKDETTLLTSEELDSGNNSMQNFFFRNEGNGEFGALSRPLRPGEEMYHEIEYQLVKEGEDNEPFRTRHPSKGMRITVFDRTMNRRLNIDGEVIHRDTFTSKADGNGNDGIHSFEFDRWLLPHQGIIIYWKNIQNDI